MSVATEKRSARRYALDWPVCVYHQSTNRFFQGHTVNISQSGALVRLPLSAPIQNDQTLEVNFPAPEGLDADRYPARLCTAQVVRVNRPQSILHGEQGVALQFSS